MKQPSFASLTYASKKKQTRRELFLAEMERVVPWSKLEALITPHYPTTGRRGRQPMGVSTMLRIHFLQQWYALSDPAMEDALYEIESMRAHAPIQGYVITEMTDVHWEANGLLDINRNPRAFHDRFAEVNNDLVIVPQIDRHALWSGDSVALKLKVATGGASIPAGATLTWSAEAQTGRLDVPAAGGLAVVHRLAR